MDWPFFVTGALVVFFTGVSKSGFAGGFSALGVPALSLFVLPQTAAAIMLPILCLIDVANIWHYRRDWDRRLLTWLIPAAITGIVIGALTFRHVDPDALKLGIAGFAFWFAIAAWPRSQAAVIPGKPGGPLSALFFGSLAGFTSFIAHAGGPPVKGYLLSQRLEKTRFVATNSVFFFIVNQIKLLPYFMLGQFSTANLSMTLSLLPFVPLGVLAGFWMHRRVPQQVFSKVVCVLLLLAGVKLFYDSWHVLV